CRSRSRRLFPCPSLCQRYAHPPDLHSFPTRRSSDLAMYSFSSIIHCRKTHHPPTSCCETANRSVSMIRSSAGMHWRLNSAPEIMLKSQTTCEGLPGSISFTFLFRPKYDFDSHSCLHRNSHCYHRIRRCFLSLRLRLLVYLPP